MHDLYDRRRQLRRNGLRLGRRRNDRRGSRCDDYQQQLGMLYEESTAQTVATRTSRATSALRNIAYLASSGDSGYNEIEWPAALENVLAVGGNQLEECGSTFTETIWDGAGAGCATTVTKPSWQHDPDCAGRTIADVSAQAGRDPGVADTTADYGGWVGVCGTSVATPLTAGIVGLAGNASSLFGGETFWKFSNKQHRRKFNVIHSGSDGSCGTYLCEAGAQRGADTKPTPVRADGDVQSVSGRIDFARRRNVAKGGRSRRPPFCAFPEAVVWAFGWSAVVSDGV